MLEIAMKDPKGKKIQLNLYVEAELKEKLAQARQMTGSRLKDSDLVAEIISNYIDFWIETEQSKHRRPVRVPLRVASQPYLSEGMEPPKGKRRNRQVEADVRDIVEDAESDFRNNK